MQALEIVAIWYANAAAKAAVAAARMAHEDPITRISELAFDNFKFGWHQSCIVVSTAVAFGALSACHLWWPMLLPARSQPHCTGRPAQNMVTASLSFPKATASRLGARALIHATEAAVALILASAMLSIAHRQPSTRTLALVPGLLALVIALHAAGAAGALFMKRMLELRRDSGGHVHLVKQECLLGKAANVLVMV
jgi:hypothetical protein